MRADIQFPESGRDLLAYYEAFGAQQQPPIPTYAVDALRNGLIPRDGLFELKRASDAILYLDLDRDRWAPNRPPVENIFWLDRVTAGAVLSAAPSLSGSGWDFDESMLPTDEGVLLWGIPDFDYVGFHWGRFDPEANAGVKIPAPDGGALVYQPETEGNALLLTFLPRDVFRLDDEPFFCVVRLGAHAYEFEALSGPPVPDPNAVNDDGSPVTDEQVARRLIDLAFGAFTAVNDPASFHQSKATTNRSGVHVSKKAEKKQNRKVVNGKVVVTVALTPEKRDGQHVIVHSTGGGGKHSYEYPVGTFKRRQWYPSLGQHIEIEVKAHKRGIHSGRTKAEVKKV